MQKWIDLFKTKTVRLAVVAELGAIYGFWAGAVTVNELIGTTYATLTVIFLRDGVSKSGPAA